jgi:hypothetical protein
MGVTQLKAEQYGSGSVERTDLNTTSAGKAVVAKIIAGTNITISQTGVDAGTGDVTINATGGGISSISIATANGISGTSSGGLTPILTLNLGAITPTTIVASSTITGSNLSGTNTGDNSSNSLYDFLITTKVNNLFYASPNGSAGIPTFRAIGVSDIPILNQNTTGSAATLTTGRTFSLTGDATGTSTTFNGSANASIPLTLVTVNSNVGTFGDSTNIPVLTVNDKGLITAISTVAASGGGGGITDGNKNEIDVSNSGANWQMNKGLIRMISIGATL